MTFSDPNLESPVHLFNMLTSVVNENYKDKLGDFISKVGSAWVTYYVENFYLTTSPTFNGFVTCPGLTSSKEFNGLKAGYALKEYNESTLS